MAAKQKQFIFEVVADLATTKESLLSEVPLSDLRLSIALADLPVIHIKPKETPTLSGEGEMRSVSFGGIGKLCVFSMTKQDLDSQNLVLLLLKEVSAISDYLILTMSPPISLQDLILSLPSSNLGDHVTVPFATRSFSFIDGMGSCSVRLRLTASLTDSMRTSQLRSSLRLHGKSIQKMQQESTSDLPPVPTINQLIEKTSEEISAKTSQSSLSIKYGGLRKRNPIIRN
jgi:hypothetical protein